MNTRKRSTGELFSLGDQVEVRLVEALPYAGSLRLELLRDGAEGRPRVRPERRGRTRPGPSGKPERERPGKRKAGQPRESRRTRAK